MTRNINYTFARQPSDALPPRFDWLSARLESIEIYGAMLSHPNSDWNRIILTLGENIINQRNLERIFKEAGYELIIFPKPISLNSRKT
ncbi:MAG: hypothetical protein AABY16_03705 [Nanoarchaeota archaeon]